MATKSATVPAELVGTHHRIAGLGPSYEVLRLLDETMARIVILETGEEVDYPIEEIRRDPHPDVRPHNLHGYDEDIDITPVSVDRATAQKLVGEWRKFGHHGPRYEVLEIETDTEAKIRVHTSGEVASYPIADILRDPVD